MKLYGVEKCDGCSFLKEEKMPRGAAMKRCMKPGDKYGRAVNFSSVGEFTVTYRPMWCEGEKECGSAKRNISRS